MWPRAVGLLGLCLLSTWIARADAPRSLAAAMEQGASALVTEPAPELPKPPAARPGRVEREGPAQIATASTEAPVVMTAGAQGEQPVVQAVVTLPIPEAPAQPEQPREFAAPLHDPAGAAARSIARRVARFRRYRSEIPGATWRVDEAAAFRIRADIECRRALKRAGVNAHLVERELTTPVPSPVSLDGAVDGVTFHSLHTDREVEMACELAVRLPAIVAVLKRHGVNSVSVLSSYREEPRTSFHTFGLALDIAAFRTDDGVLVVRKHFEQTPGQYTCDAKPLTPEGQALLSIACDLAASNLLSSVLTPNYNEGHRDHFHLDIRPDDPRVFLR